MTRSFLICSTETLMASDSEARRLWPAPSEPMRVARRIVESRTLEGVALIRRWRGDWMEWTGSHWATMEEAALKELLYSLLEDATYFDTDKNIKPWSPARNKIANVAEALGAVVLLSEKTNPPTWVPTYAGSDPKQLVVVANGHRSCDCRCRAWCAQRAVAPLSAARNGHYRFISWLTSFDHGKEL